MTDDEQRWDLPPHRVVVRPTGWSRTTTWTVDGEVVAEKRSSEDKLVLDGGEHGLVRVLFSWSGSSRRVTWFAESEKVQAHAGLGGTDLDPEPGSKAALREARMRARPRLYAARHVVAGVAKVVVPLAVVWLLSRVAFDLPHPDLPRPDLPHLPSLPLPSVHLPDWHLPGWVRWALEKKNYVLPVVVGTALAVAEVRRRRRQDELKRLRQPRSDALRDSGPAAGHAPRSPAGP